MAVIKAVGLGDRQMISEADTARMGELERDKERIEHQILRARLAAYAPSRKKDQGDNE
jgi:hypothetical protein